MTIIIKDNGLRKLKFDEKRLKRFIEIIGKDFPKLATMELAEVVINDIQAKKIFEAEDINNQIILRGLERIDIDEPEWTKFCASVYLKKLYKAASKNRAFDAKQSYGSFYELLKKIGSKGIYRSELLRDYSKEEIQEIEKMIEPNRDKLFTYIGLRTLADRYLTNDHDGNVYELPQERFAVVAMSLMIQEPKKIRMSLIKDAYWALSHLYMTVATPTLSNAGKTHGQLSSCFIDSVEDSLESIMYNNLDVAKLSKDGGGIGVYIGYIRSKGSNIKNFIGKSSGVIPWMKQLNTIAVNVDQLGQRQGAISVYLDVWHKDIFSFLDAKLNNGDERQRTHDLFTGVTLPDLFMEQVEKRGDWFLFDPYEVKKVMGYYLQDFYDENETKNNNNQRVVSGEFRKRYWDCVDNSNIHKTRVPAIEIMKRIMVSQLETGTPYMFYRDEVNRKNPNSHVGMVDASNLCSEIAQNNSPTTVKEEYTSDGKIVTIREPGDFVVCNLSSINLAKAVTEDVLERLIPIEMRMLDNVIDLNTLSVLQAKITNKKYRAVGLGTFGWAHLLALKNIHWQSEGAVEYADSLYEKIAYLTIKASMDLSKEKGWYPAFQNSDWHTGKYFEKRGYETKNSEIDWDKLKENVMKFGLRNGYLMAVAPNSTTSIIAGSTASIDPVFNISYSEEKKDYKIPVTVPDLTADTYPFYVEGCAYKVDQKWSIKQNAKRQRHIDQAISFNIYVHHDILAKDLLDIHLEAWKNKLKTTYYVRSTSGQEIEECEVCSS
ncbi:MAG: ribonucleoside-diphosphate reductase subunit alpha [Bacillus sp. (in: Bacteria)]|nr:ribonucleoside-diphosphate reductase subunit alpha [Bacillus sp. (in: firmicutes)]